MKVTIETATQNHIREIIELTNHELGIDFITYDQIISFIQNTDTNICKIAINDDDKIVGFMIGYIINYNQFVSEFKNHLNKLPIEFSNSNNVYGCIKTIAVNADFQGQGIGSLLCTDCVDELKKKGASLLYGTAWKINEKINSEKMLNRFGLRALCSIPYFWKDESILNQYECPQCGKPPCNCTAVIFGNEN
jgi:ribosomal protein S18 acetylase RimI-like enzyme